MAHVKQKVKRTTYKITRTKKTKSTNKKRGNPNRCPTCGRFM